MIACFPDAYPDELLYSLCARYADRMQFPSKRAIFRDIFGTNRLMCTIEIPTHLDALVARLPVEQECTVDTLIDRHTLLPLYAPFLAPERLHLVRTYMRGGKSKFPGVVQGYIAPRSQLRFCPVCVVEDRLQFGETYWHRVHQALGVEVCPKHAVFVQVSPMTIWRIRDDQHYFSAEALLTADASCVVQPIDRTNATHLLLFALAQDISWLLTYPQTALDVETTRARYLYLLKEHGVLQRQALFTAFADTYSAELLARLQVPLQESASSSWPVLLMRKKPPIYHPLRHLLMIHFLGHTVETFLQLPTNEEPFGRGPWPCLNPLCDRYHECLIRVCQISYYTGYKQKPVGKFACACGFVYARCGPDRDPADQFRHTDVITFGLVWETRLTELWLDTTYSLRDIARRLGTRHPTVRHHAQRLGLPFPRPGHPAPRPRVGKPLQDRVKRDSVIALLPAKRAAWLAVIQNYRDGGAASWQGPHRPLYIWLGRHDREWRTSNTPRRANYRDNLGAQRPNYQSVWPARDSQYAPMIRAAAAHIRHMVPLKRVNADSLSRVLFPGKERFLPTHLDKLPHTAQIVTEETETHELFQIRRIAWAATRYRDAGHLPTRRQFTKRVGVYPIREQPHIRAAIDAAFRVLEEALPKSPERTDEP